MQAGGNLLLHISGKEKALENKKTNFYSIIHSICKEQGIACRDYADGWAFELYRECGEGAEISSISGSECNRKGSPANKKSSFIFGYQFGLNLSAVQQICNDKGAASEVMEAKGIPHVHHQAFMCPPMQKFVGGDGCFQEILDVFEAQGRNLVVKDNEGTGGHLVFHVTRRKELELAAFEIFSSCNSIALCPYYDILQEYRVVLLDGEVKVIFSKIRQGITGDGASTLLELYQAYLAEEGAKEDGAAKRATVEQAAAESGFLQQDLTRISENGQFYPFQWKHNLGQGAGALLIDPEDVPEAVALAKKAAEALQVRFGSFDVVRTAEGMQILEVNTGVMMENLAGMSEENYRLVKSVYTEAIEKSLYLFSTLTDTSKNP